MLKVSNLRFGYDKNIIIDNLSFEIEEGEIVGLIGKSGSGKSTILRLIAGLEKQWEGNIFLDDKEITHAMPYHRDVAYVFQSLALFPHLTVKKNILYGIKHLNKKEQKEKLNYFTQMLEISNYLNRYPHELSGGQKQRVAIARSLVTSPKLLLLDEPFSTLDAELRKTVRKEIREILKRHNITTIIVTHDKQDVDDMCNRIINV